MRLEIRGAEQLGELARQLKAAGDSGKGLRREMFRGINRATKPLKTSARTAAAAKLPQSGGLAERVAGGRFGSRSFTGRNPGVAVTAKGSGMVTDRGYVRHPVFGNDMAWVQQSVKGRGWFTNTMRLGAPLVRREIVRAMNSVANKIGR